MRSALLLPILVATSSALAWDGDTIKGNGDVATETRKVTDFTAIEVGGGFEVEVKKGAPSLLIEAERNLLELIRSEVKGGTLIVGTKPHVSIDTNKRMRVVITAPSLTGISAAGGIDINVDVPVIKAAKIAASGGVQMRIAGIDSDSLVLDASGGADLLLTGKTGAMTIDASGGVHVTARALAAKTLKVDASGGCDLDVSVSDSVKGEISGGVDLRLHGHPKVEVEESLGTSIRVRD